MKYFLFLIIFFHLHSFAQTVQWRGPKRDGHYPSKDLLKSWPENGPECILSIDGLGKGYSSVIYSEGIMYITGMKDTMDYISACNLNGDILWQVPYGRSWIRSYPDTRGTPTLENERLYVISGTGCLVCLNKNTGNILWNVNVDSSYHSVWNTFGIAEAPLIVDNKVICTPGGDYTTMVAFNKYSGDLIWKTKSLGGTRIYASPALLDYKNLRQIVGMTNHHVFGVNPDDGKIQWSYDFFPEHKRVKRKGAYFTNTPLFKEYEIYVTSGYDVPSVLLELTPDGMAITEKWVDTVLDNHHHGVVMLNGHIYGANWQNNKQGKWVCLEWETGSVRYEHDWETKGSIIRADGLLYLYEERNGTVALVKPNPDTFEIISSFNIEKGNGPHWAHPAIYDGMLFIRHGEVVMVFDIAKGQ